MPRVVGEIRTRVVPGGVLAVGYSSCNGLTVKHRAFVPVHPEVGGKFGSRLVKFAKKVAKNKVVKGIVNAAMSVVKSTPYGAAASAALNVAKGAVRAIKGQSSGGRGRGASRGSRALPAQSATRGGRNRPTPARARGQNRPAAIRLDPVALAVLQARGVRPHAKIRMLQQLAGVAR